MVLYNYLPIDPCIHLSICLSTHTHTHTHTDKHTQSFSPAALSGGICFGAGGFLECMENKAQTAWGRSGGHEPGILVLMLLASLITRLTISCNRKERTQQYL